MEGESCDGDIESLYDTIPAETESSKLNNKIDINRNIRRFIRISIPDITMMTTVEIHQNETIWDIKQRLLSRTASLLKDAVNYGLYMPPSKGRAGKFMADDRSLLDYSVSSGFVLELKYKNRVYKNVNAIKKIGEFNTKASQKKFLHALRLHNMSKLTQMLAKGLDPNFHDAETGETPMTLSLFSLSQPLTVLAALVEGGAHLDYRNEAGLTPMHKAALAGRVAPVKALLDLGASTNSRTEDGLTPLYLCLSSKNNSDPEVVELLLRDHAQHGVTDASGSSELHQVCRHGHTHQLEHLLFYGADVNIANKTGNTPLHVCALNGQEVCARLLLFRGADKTIRNDCNQTASQLATLSSYQTVAELIDAFTSQDAVPYKVKPKYNEKRRAGVGNTLVDINNKKTRMRLRKLSTSTPHLDSIRDDVSNNVRPLYDSDSPYVDDTGSDYSGDVMSMNSGDLANSKTKQQTTQLVSPAQYMPTTVRLKAKQNHTKRDDKVASIRSYPKRLSSTFLSDEFFDDPSATEDVYQNSIPRSISTPEALDDLPTKTSDITSLRDAIASHRHCNDATPAMTSSFASQPNTSLQRAGGDAPVRRFGSVNNLLDESTSTQPSDSPVTTSDKSGHQPRRCASMENILADNWTDELYQNIDEGSELFNKTTSPPTDIIEDLPLPPSPSVFASLPRTVSQKGSNADFRQQAERTLRNYQNQRRGHNPVSGVFDVTPPVALSQPPPPPPPLRVSSQPSVPVKSMELPTPYAILSKDEATDVIPPPPPAAATLLPPPPPPQFGPVSSTTSLSDAIKMAAEKRAASPARGNTDRKPLMSSLPAAAAESKRSAGMSDLAAIIAQKALERQRKLADGQLS